jgi:hypothetical protein
MDCIIHKLGVIHDIFHNEYVYKSILICKSQFELFYMMKLLNIQDYPIVHVNHENHKTTIDKFLNNKARMLVVSPLMFDVLTKYKPTLFQDCNFVFVPPCINVPSSWNSDKNIIFI